MGVFRLYAEFPVTKCINPEILDKDVRTQHENFSRYVKLSLPRARNLFVCGFRFVLSEEEPIWIFLEKDDFIDIDPELSLNELQIRHVYNRAKNNFSVLGILSIKEQNLIFSNHAPNEDIGDCLAALQGDCRWVMKNKKERDAGFRNQFMLLKDIEGRASSDVMRSTDSEAGAIYVLQHKCVIDKIIEKASKEIDKLDKKIQVKSIEFHGCTSRDMCALCFTNMNIIQYLCNYYKTAPTEYGPKFFLFLEHIRNFLKTNGRASADCSVKMFISSTIEDRDNLNFSIDSTASQEGDFLYQFRILPVEGPSAATSSPVAE